MRPIEKKISNRISKYKSTIEHAKSYNLSESEISYIRVRIHELEWVLSELQKESDLMQEMLIHLEYSINDPIGFSWDTPDTIKLIQKVKQQLDNNDNK